MHIKYKGKNIDLNGEAELMAIHFVKKLDTPYVQDEVFVKNFLTDFIIELQNSSKEFNDVFKGELNIKDFDFSEIKSYLEKVKAKTDAMSKEEKKLTTQLKKQLRDKLKEKYGYAIVDGQKMPLQNWIAEPASIFISKGKNPLRGHWKRAIRQEEITLNCSQEPEEKGWGKIVWRPDETWIASWKSPLDGKMKYVWFSPATSIRQAKEQKKFSLASNLEKDIDKLERYIQEKLVSKEKEERKLATAVYLIKNLAIRVGDEKIAGEHGTVGCTTLKPENVRLDKSLVILDFIGKDYVHWHRELTVPRVVYENLREFIKEAGEDFIFKGLDSNKVSSFLRKVIPGLSAKVFRTYMAGKVWDEAAKANLAQINKDSPIELKKYFFKMTNLVVAQKLNHKKALAKNWAEKLAKKEETFRKEQLALDLLKDATAEKIQKQERKALKALLDLESMKATAEWNLNTSLTSYIDPHKVVAFTKKAGLSIEDVYSKSLREKYSWAIGDMIEKEEQ